MLGDECLDRQRRATPDGEKQDPLRELYAELLLA
jgi:hypothetical protein